MTPQWLLDQELEDTKQWAALKNAYAREQRKRREAIDQDDPRIRRIRGACSDHSTIDVDQHAANVYLALEQRERTR